MGLFDAYIATPKEEIDKIKSHLKEVDSLYKELKGKESL